MGSQELSVLEEGDEEPLEPPDVSLYDHTGQGALLFYDSAPSFCGYLFVG